MESPLINGTIVSFSLIHVSRCNAKMPRQPFIQASAQNANGGLGSYLQQLPPVGSVGGGGGAVLYPVLD